MLPIGRVVGPDDVAALAVHVMANTALTGATYDIDGGQQLLPRGCERWSSGSGPTPLGTALSRPRIGARRGRSRVPRRMQPSPTGSWEETL
jgi:hypothetical protein